MRACDRRVHRLVQIVVVKVVEVSVLALVNHHHLFIVIIRRVTLFIRVQESAHVIATHHAFSALHHFTIACDFFCRFYFFALAVTACIFAGITIHVVIPVFWCIFRVVSVLFVYIFIFVFFFFLADDFLFRLFFFVTSIVTFSCSGRFRGACFELVDLVATIQQVRERLPRRVVKADPLDVVQRLAATTSLLHSLLPQDALHFVLIGHGCLLLLLLLRSSYNADVSCNY